MEREGKLFVPHPSDCSRFISSWSISYQTYFSLFTLATGSVRRLQRKLWGRLQNSGGWKPRNASWNLWGCVEDAVPMPVDSPYDYGKDSNDWQGIDQHFNYWSLFFLYVFCYWYYISSPGLWIEENLISWTFSSKYMDFFEYFSKGWETRA